MGVKNWNWRKIKEASHRIFTTNKLDLTLRAPSHGTKNIIKVKSKLRLSKRIQTDGQHDDSDFIICPMLCYSNGTDEYAHNIYTINEYIINYQLMNR